MSKGPGRIDTIVAAIITIALRQHGCITRAQLLQIGMSPTTIAEWVARRRLFRIHAGVYAVGRPLTTPVEHAAAALLACGPTAALSHHSALAAWGLARTWPVVPQVTVCGRRRKPRIDIHRSRCLTPDDVRRQLGMRVTSPARTLLDCAPMLSTVGLNRALADARRAGRLRPAQLDDALTRFANHPGQRLIRSIRDDTQAPTRSTFEDLFPRFCRRHGLPHPRLNTIVNGREVDAYFPAQRVIVELDGWEFHRDRAEFESDRDHDASALVAGLITYRLTWRRLTQEPEQEAARLHAVLANRRT